MIGIKEIIDMPPTSKDKRTRATDRVYKRPTNPSYMVKQPENLNFRHHKRRGRYATDAYLKMHL